MTRYGIIILAVVAILCGPGCGMKSPEDERRLAEKAFKDALSGKDCAREDFLAAEELLMKAREAVNAKKYDEAKKLFLSAKEKADKIAAYVRSHPDECDPKAKKEKGAQRTAGVDGEGISEETLSSKDPNMKFPVIHFEFNEYAVRADDIPLLKIMAEWMVNFPAAAIRVEGHADERGSIDYNMSLGERRAQEVRDELLKLGVDAKRFQIVSYGEERPIASGQNEAAWFQNRRAEFVRVN